MGCRGVLELQRGREIHHEGIYLATFIRRNRRKVSLPPWWGCRENLWQSEGERLNSYFVSVFAAQI